MSKKIEELKKHDKLYGIGTPTITDTEYDTLKDEARCSYPDDPYFNTVGSDSRDKVKLPFILGSLNKTKPDGSCSKWLKKHNDDIVLTPKLDGVSILVNFYKGVVVNAFLRGDGEFGQNITNKAKQFIPNIKEKTSVWGRGEILLDKIPEGYKNKRNCVAGIINDDDSEYLLALKALFYEYVNADIDTELDRLQAMESFGLSVPTYNVVQSEKLTDEKLTEILVEIKEEYLKLGFDTDGIVLTKNISDRENVKYPENKVAFKVNQEAISTTVKSIEWNTSRTGKIKPVVIIEPIEINGATINRATAYNAKYIDDEGIQVGSVVGIVRSGEIIPYICSVNEGGTAVLPTKCPSCDSNLTMIGVDLVCDNDGCDTKTNKKLEFFVKSMGMMNISKKTIEKLNVTTIKELYELTVDSIKKLDGFGIKKATGIVDELRNKLVTTPDKFLSSLGISGLGKTNSKLLLKNISFDDLFTTEDFSTIDGIGDITSKNIVDGLKEGYSTFTLLKEYGMEWEEVESGSEFFGKILTLTGTAPLKRDDLVRILENKGCQVKNITKKTDFLVTNDVDSNSSKTTKAKKYGIPLMTYDELIEKLNLID